MFVTEQQQNDAKSTREVYYAHNSLRVVMNSFGSQNVNKETGKIYYVTGPYKQCFPVLCRVKVVDVRYLNIFPGSSARTSAQRLDNLDQINCWTHDLLLKMEIEKIYFDENHYVNVGDTITAYALECGKQSDQYRDYRWNRLSFSFPHYAYTIPDDLFPFYKIGEQHMVKLYKTEYLLDSDDPYDKTVRWLSDFYLDTTDAWSKINFKYHLDFGSDNRFPVLGDLLTVRPRLSYYHPAIQDYLLYLGKTREELLAVDDRIMENKAKRYIM